MSLCVHVGIQVGGLFANDLKQLCFEPCVDTMGERSYIKEGPYQDRPPLCPFRLLPLLIYSGSTIASLKFQGPKSKNIGNKILLQP